jgi:hypothetical protein
LQLFTVCVLSTPGLSADKPELTRVFPPGGQRGTAVDVEATGKFVKWPIQIWSDTDSIQWECQKESGKLRVTIAADAAVGLHWVRFFNADGATAVRPFLVGLDKERIETEPNDQPSTANEISFLPHTVQGILNKRADVDMVSVAMKAGQILAATIDSDKWLQSPADASLQIMDGNGFVLCENLDHVGLDPYLEFLAPRTEKYYVRVFGFPATPDSTVAFGGGNDWSYRLRLAERSEPFSSAHAYSAQRVLESKRIEADPGKHVTLETALPIQLPARVGGVIAARKQSNYLAFSAKSGRQYRVQILAREFGSQLDAAVAILDAKGKQLAQQDDAGKDRDPELNWKAPADGDYLIAVNDFHRGGSSDHRFLAVVEERAPNYSITIPNDLIAGTVGKDTELTVTIDRENDYKEGVQISAIDLPESVECSVAESKNGSDSGKKVTIKFKAKSPFQGPIKIMAKRSDTTGSTESVDEPKYATVPNGKPIWLSVVAE